jgi:AcrR family transcriptional regulator
MAYSGEDLDEKRRTQIVEAALHCFLTFGYAKTSMDDIAKKAGVSRPLIYVKFRNKEALFAGVYGSLTAGRIERAMQVVNGKGTRTERLVSVLEIMLVQPWAEIVGHPMSTDFYTVCALQLPQVTSAYRRNSIKCAEVILDDREVAEVFFYSTEGLHRDLPSTKELRRRLRILAQQFGRD